MTYFEDVRAFHRGAKQPARTKLKVIRGREREFRADLLHEETEELLDAMYAARDREDLVAVAGELVDVVYVVLGAALHYGIDFDAVWAEMHAANMRKLDGPDGKPVMRDDGKVVKPPGWQPADVGAVLARAA